MRLPVSERVRWALAIPITMSSERGDYLPHVTQAHAEAAARRLHFRLIQTMRLPDGRLLRVWSQLT
jgi:hypothetical protein